MRDNLDGLVRSRTADLHEALDEVTTQSLALEASRQREITLHKSVFAGRLASGLAHEVNSPLACLIANQDYLKGRLEEMDASMKNPGADWRDFAAEAFAIFEEDNRSLLRVKTAVGTLEGFCVPEDYDQDRLTLPSSTADEILRETKHALEKAGIAREQVTFGDIVDSCVAAHTEDVSLALVSLLRFLLEHKKSVPHDGESTRDTSKQTDMSTSRHVLVKTSKEDSYCLIELSCEAFDSDIGAAETAFDPSLVIEDGTHVKLSVELSTCATRIARSGGSIGFSKSPSTGITLQVRFGLSETGAQRASARPMGLAADR